MNIENEVKNNHFEFVKAQSSKEALDKFFPKTGAENELKFLIETDNFAFEPYCLSILAFKLIEDEKSSDLNFDDQEAKKSVAENLQKLFAKGGNVDLSWLNKLSPTERAVAYSLLLLRDQVFNEDCSNRGMNEKLAGLLLNGCLITSEYEAVKINENLEETRKRYEKELQEQEEKGRNCDYLTKVSHKLFLTLIKRSLNQDVINLGVKAVKMANCL